MKIYLRLQIDFAGAPPLRTLQREFLPLEPSLGLCGAENPRSKERVTLGFVHPARKLLITLTLAHFADFAFAAQTFNSVKWAKL